MTHDGPGGAPVTAPADPMRFDRFTTLVGAYGADPERWPEAERAAALTLLAFSVEARALRDEAASLDALLDQADVEERSISLSAGLAGRIVAMAPRPAETEGGAQIGQGPSTRGLGWGQIRAWLGAIAPEAADWRGAAALAASLLIGIAVGYALPIGDGVSGWTLAEQETIDSFAFGGVVSEDPSL